MTNQSDVTPDEILEFWFPDGPNPEPKRHMELWMWRMRGGANKEILKKYTKVTERAASGEYDDWSKSALGRLALIVLLDQFPRTVWAGTPKAFSQDPKALALCLEGLENGHFDALENVWYKSVFKLPLEHCECAQHMSNLDRAIEIADKIVEEAPEHLKDGYKFGAGQPRKHRAVIARFGRHAHRNEVLGRKSTAEELEYIAKGEFPHEVDINLDI
ncbi:DUF924 domain-containing protein [Aliiroseovarius sp. M344]|uniref:DUF924 family protein n=1 Tax=Aliiroseovarius sp. M344 TaxID=2867010 RepID=UPI0021AD6428|nr:DUF924 family protein [Aliiroseovarius sp. M344]UWQ13715.1 DUF924 domain-containing protein [Aliiroseovarius sp. M344]